MPQSCLHEFVSFSSCSLSLSFLDIMPNKTDMMTKLLNLLFIEAKSEMDHIDLH